MLIAKLQHAAGRLLIELSDCHGSKEDSLVFGPCLYGDHSIVVRTHIQHDGPTTDLAIFNVFLLSQRIVGQDRYSLTTVGATNCFFMNFRHDLG